MGSGVSKKTSSPSPTGRSSETPRSPEPDRSDTEVVPSPQLSPARTPIPHESLPSLEESSTFDSAVSLGLSERSSVGRLPPIKMQAKQSRGLGRTVSTIGTDERQELENRHKELKNAFKMFQKATDFVSSEGKRREEYFQELNAMLHNSILKQFEKFKEEEQRHVMGNKLAELGFVPAAIDYYKYLLEEVDVTEVTCVLVEEGKTSKDPGILLIMTFREIFWNFSDDNGYFARELSKTSLFEYLSADLKAIKDDEFEDLNKMEDIFAYSSAVGVLHNCARESEFVDRDAFRRAKISKRLYPFVESRQMYVKMITVLALAHIVDEDESDKLGLEDAKVFDFLFKEIKTALTSADQKSSGFSVSELVDGLASLSQSNKNKDHIMQLEPLPTIRKLLASDSVKTLLATVGLVWELCFKPEIRAEIAKDAELVKLLRETKLQGDRELSQNAEKALFCVDGRLTRRPSRLGSSPALPEKPLQRVETRAATKQKHIMISYQWNNQPTILKLRDDLVARGYSVWLDKDNMGSYLLQGMAEAVEGAFLVLICYSEKYKLSRNCRMEADYTYTLNKPFLPLKMQAGYTPDGWLGIFIGAKVYYEFSGKYKYEDKFEEMLKAIKDTESPDLPPAAEQPANQPAPRPLPAPPTSSQQNVESWDKEKISGWLRTNKLEPGKLSRLKTLTGEQIVFLSRVYKHAPDTFYKFLEKKLGVSSLEDIMNLTNAVIALGL